MKIDRTLNYEEAANFLNMSTQKLRSLRSVIVPYQYNSEFSILYKLSDLVKWDLVQRPHVYRIDEKPRGRRDFTHEEVVDIAVEWLEKEKCCELILKEYRNEKNGEVPDVIGWDSSGVSYKIECKVSSKDMHNEWNKSWRYQEKFTGAYKWVMCPKKVTHLKTILFKNWGMLEVDNDGHTKEILPAKFETPCRELELRMLRNVLIRVTKKCRKSGIFDKIYAPEIYYEEEIEAEKPKLNIDLTHDEISEVQPIEQPKEEAFDSDIIIRTKSKCDPGVPTSVGENTDRRKTGKRS